ncbi:MAG TPA: ATP-dependent Clp protease ATP-binding subunit ClpA [Acidobacteria bacterium]|nr:ATP-dependent Clp protease ATP-binding subunit ClpA [Acidobacteriota bacterium]
MKLSADLEICVSVALTQAGEKGHRFAGPEHLLHALLMDEDVANTVRHAGGDVAKLKKELERYLEEEVEVQQGERQIPPLPTRGLRRVLARAAAHARGAGLDEVTTVNALVAVYDEEDSWAVYLLEEHGVTKLDVVSYLAHGVSKIDPAGTGWQVGAGGEEEGSRPTGDPLDAFTTELTELARQGAIDPLIGRDREIARTLRVLQRRRKNNPVYVGDPGVGKTALVEGLALKIAQGEVPAQLEGATIYRLDLGATLAGARYRGDFEERLKGVLAALAERPRAILFIDEIHTLVGAGATGTGTVDASNLLKPALESGRLRCIGATTWSEYRQYFERDRALARRFQKIEVNEPSVEETVKILQGLKQRHEEHHGVSYTRAALSKAAELAARHLRDHKLPDKAIDLMDEAGAEVSLAGGKRVGTREIEAALAAMARIPPKKVRGSDRERLLHLEQQLKAVIYGQDEAIGTLVAAIKVSRAGLRSPEKPIGSFLLTGPTGVGKTELARQLAEALGIAFLRFDMSEYMERHSVSRLVGAPPGYVGYDRGGLLTEAVSQSPHAVLLLDEVEKAHPEVFNILLQIMDHGTLTDTNGKEADFRQVILLMSSNVGAREMAQRQVGFAGGTAASADQQAYERLFSPEFRNRLDARVGFAPLTPDVMERIVDKFIDELRRQLKDRKVNIELTDQARAHLAEKGYDPAFGARPLARVIDETIKKPLTEQILFGRLEHGGNVVVRLEGGEIVLS